MVLGTSHVLMHLSNSLNQHRSFFSPWYFLLYYHWTHLVRFFHRFNYASCDHLLVSGRITLGSWVGNHNRAKGINHKETDKQVILILKQLNLVQKILPVGPTFEVVPIRFKPYVSSLRFKTCNPFKEKHIHPK